MIKNIVISLATALLLSACASTTPTISLSDINPKRVYAIDRDKILDAMHLFCRRYDYTLTGTEPETGRVTGYKKIEGLRQEENRTILMLIYVIKLPDGKSQVESKFVYQRLDGTLSKHDESLIVECYTSLFKYLDKLAE